MNRRVEQLDRMAQQLDAVEQLLRASETRFRAFASALDAAFAVVELLEPGPGGVLDCRLIEVNHMFEAMTGISGPVIGRTARELVPELEPKWFELAASVVHRQEPVRLRDSSEALARSFDLFAAPMAPDGCFAIVFRDHTEREAGDRRARFLMELSDALRPLAGPIVVQETAARMLGRHLDASRVFYAEHDSLRGVAFIARDFTNGVDSLEGRHVWADFSLGGVEQAQDGRTWTAADVAGEVDDARRAGFAMFGVRAAVTVPLIKRGEVVAVLGVHNRTPRSWSEGEVALVEDVAERTWAAVQRARAEARLRASEERERRARKRAELLSEIVVEIDTSADLVEAFQRLVSRLVPAVAAFAAIESRARDGTIRRLAGSDFDHETTSRHGGARWEVVPLGGGFGDDIRLVVELVGVELRPHLAEDLAFVREIGARIGPALTAQRIRKEEHRIASRLQAALLPVGVLQHPEVAIAARYEARGPLLEVGGDWYDTFALPSGRIALAVGDVGGHGLEAAATMGKLRVAIAALAPHATGPGQLLSQLDTFAAGAEGGDFATACFATFDPKTSELHFASAGHLPILVVATDGSHEWLEGGRSGPLVGDVEPVRPQASVKVAPDSLLVLCSDGLVERRGEPIAAGLKRLSQAAAEVRDAPIDRVCDELIERMGVAESRQDDVVVLCLRAPARILARFRRTLPAVAGELRQLRGALRLCLPNHAPHPPPPALVLAVGEACANAIEHAYVDAAPGLIEVAVDQHASGMLAVTVRDFGRWRPEARDEPASRGRGLAIMRSLTTDFAYESAAHGATVKFKLAVQ
jgi:serine phosphatase RsbU (regulator of sigma subunit)/GAF domain-containing protein/anti-sigma regulatory factor (Ser/Thr protein kinase)